VIEVLDGEGGQRGLHRVHHHGHGGATDRHGIGRVRLRQVSEPLDIGALVAVVGNRLLARQGEHRFSELSHLRPGVVDVELALDLMAAIFKNTRERVPVGGIAGVTHVHRPGRVG
jgi:hypothetical protein